MRQFLLFLASLLVSVSALGAEVDKEGERIDVQLGVGSYHFTERADGLPWNHRNTGIAVQYVVPGTLWGQDVEYCGTIGEIKNSAFGESVFAGGCIKKKLFESSLASISVGAFAGAMTYPSRYYHGRNQNAVFPVVLPGITASLGKGVYVDATLIPAINSHNNSKEAGTIDEKGSAAILFTVRFTLKHW